MAERGPNRGAYDTAFTIADVTSVRVHAPGPDYWRGFIARDASSTPADRFVFSPPWRTVYARAVETALVRVRLTDGTVGWGEATCPVAPEVVCVLANGFVAELVRDRTFGSVAALVDLLYDAQRCRGYLAGHLQDAVAALDIALHDALGKRARRPVCDLLGGAVMARLPCYLSGARAETRAERVGLLEAWAAEGGHAVKIFLRGALQTDLEEVAALRDAVPRIDWWAVDALWTYEDPAIAATAKAAFGSLGTRWLECPMLPEDLDGHAHLRAQPGTAIALGEHFRTALQVAPWIVDPAVDVLQPDIGRTGFVMAGRMRADAMALGVRVTPHMGGALDVMQAATLHFAAACGGDLPCEYQAGLANRLPDVVRSQWRRTSGSFEVPEAPGLGIDIDEHALQRFIVSA
ncbi:MAG: mandelate racemase/muconate lactonizing enzyme family protein [Casimicrobiaceae bacterium]